MPRLDRLNLLIIVMAVLGAAHILVRTSTYGSAMAGASVTYLSTAENIIAAEGLQDFRGFESLTTPPLYPLILAGIGLAGIEPLEGARLVNVVTFGLTILLSGFWLRRTLGSPLLMVGVTLALTTSHYLSYFSSWILTESLFILFTIFALMQMKAFSNRTVVWRSLMVAAVFTALAAVTRYAGIAVILTGIVMLLCRRGSPLVARLTYAAVYGVLSSLPVGTVFVRQYLLFGDFSRKYGWVGLSLSELLNQYTRLFSEEIVPANMPDWVRASLLSAFSLAVFACLAICVYAALRGRAKPPFKYAVSPSLLTRAFNSAGLKSVLPFAMFSFVYLIFISLVLFFRVGGTPAVDIGRYFLPPYVSLLLLGAWLFDRFLRIHTHGWTSAAKWVSASLILLVSLGHFGLWAQKSLVLTARALESGFIGETFNTAYWDESETIEYLRANPTDARVYCNRFGLLHGLLALKIRTNVRGKYPWLARNLNRLASQTENGDYIVWLKSIKGKPLRFYHFNDMDLRTLPGVETVAELSDGVVFRVTHNTPESEDGIKNAT